MRLSICSPSQAAWVTVTSGDPPCCGPSRLLAMKFKKIDNDTSASDSQGHLTWFICVYPVADVIHDSQPEVTKGVGIAPAIITFPSPEKQPNIVHSHLQDPG